MKPSNKSESLLSITRSKAKMYEYNVPEEIHIDIPRDPARLFTLTIGLLGNLAVGINSEEVTDDQLVELRQKLQFSAYFFDALQQSRLKEGLDPYLKLLGSASYYLCDLPGSASVLANSISDQPTNLDCLGLEDLLTNILKRSYSKIDVTNFLYEEPIRKISEGMIEYFNQEGNEDNIFEQTSILRKIAYENGTPRQLLFSDVISAIIKKQIENSSRRSLPQYSDLSPDQWSNILIKSSFVKELWPSQHMLGQQGIFRGKSAIVQMPTSAGKTKAIELIIRSAFIAKRATLAVIVAPYRALCNEIKNNLVKSFDDEPVSINQISDVLQVDFDIMEMLGTDQILVLTPEKLVYIIRHSPDLAEQIGLLIYDEGHQFDSGMRGITYELLVTSLKSTIPSEVQTILISAVMTNAESIGNWLNGSGSEIVSGSLLSPTYRTIAFTSWRDKRGRLEFVLPDNLDTLDFYVPRIIEQQELTLKKGERSPRIFPGRLEKKSISLYLGLKLVEKGSVAIFCGQKQTTSSLCEDVVEAFDRNLLLPKPIEFSNKEEVKRLHYLHECHLGLNAPVTQSSAIGIFAHHGNTPHGIRLAIEHAMKEGQIKFIICTSTLAQGVNLPIRYLIVATFYQGRQPIKIRDFQNLIGRAGRSGTHTEGTILFADPEVYDKRFSWQGKWRWKQVKDLLQTGNSEPSSSTILSLFDPLHNDNYTATISIEALEIVKAYIESEENISSLPEQISSLLGEGFSEKQVRPQIEWKLGIISSIESYLMAQWYESETESQKKDISELAKATLAYHLAEEQQRESLVEIFNLLAQNVINMVPNISKRRIFAKTLYGVRTSLEIENWVTEHIENLLLCEKHEDVLTEIWPIMADNIRNNTFRKCDPQEVLKEVAFEWIRGKPYFELFQILLDNNAKRIAGTKKLKFKIDHVVEICENAFAFDGTLILGAIAEIVKLIRPDGSIDLVQMITELQKKLRYGLESITAITLYELGFADRVVSSDMSSTFNVELADKNKVILNMIQRRSQLANLLRKYPAYFTERFNDIF